MGGFTDLCGLSSFGLSISAQREFLNTGVSLFDEPLSWNPTVNHLAMVRLSVTNQDYVGDINILPDKRLFNPLKLLSHRSIEEIVRLITMGERATSPKNEMVRIQTKISHTLDRILTDIDHYPQYIGAAAMRQVS